MYKQFAASLALAIALVSPSAAQADSFLYTEHNAVGPTYSYYDDFSYLSPTLITAGTTFTPDTYHLFTKGVEIVPSTFVVTIDPLSGGGEIFLSATPYVSISVDPLGESFFTVGHHSFFSGKFTLDIVDVPTGDFRPAVTPEPSSLVLLGSGVLGILGIARGRFNS